MFWGVSESFDLYEEYLNAFKIKEESSSPDPKETQTDEPDSSTGDSSNHPAALNILLFGAGDPRHVIKTMAKLYTHAGTSGRDGAGGPTVPDINFYMVDGCIEILARNIALLSIALESPECINLRNKVHLFMDVYGNALIRPASHHYLVAKSKILLKMVTDPEQLKSLAPLLSIDGLKYRDRDGLENSFHFWLPKKEHVFDITDYWEARVRKLLGARYDYREGAFDWDLSMTLKYRDAQQICSQEYRYWRDTGIAFTYPEYEHCKSNKTLSAGLVRNGKNYIHRGYVGDIQTGPFCAFGLRVIDESFSKSAHGQNDYRATDVTERNLFELFHEIKERTTYHHDKELSRKYGSVKLQMGNRFTWDECDLDVMQSYDKPWLHVEGVKVNFLSTDEILTLQNDPNGRWRNFFDIVFVGHNYFAFMKPSFTAVLGSKALLILETKFLTMFRKEELVEFETKLKNFAKEAEMENVLNYNALNTNFSVLKFRKGFRAGSG